MTPRRWQPGWYGVVGGVPFRVVPGRKGEGDRRLEWWTDLSWQPVPMAAAFLLVDFFTENEDHLAVLRPHWRVPGGDYFFGALHEARHHGWEVATAKVQEQRGRREGDAA
jgi:hypothetical protein